MRAEKPAFPPIEALPCANVQPKLRSACDGLGKMACSDCKLVSYCSKDCQKDHWKLHKRDCKSPIKSEDWLPSWVWEDRLPIFMRDETPEDAFYRRLTGEFDRGCALWGNVPAMDVINLGTNENDATKDLSIAFVASGDMRHVVKTINSLPSNFSGNLTILLNDVTTPIACRNLALLLILGTIPDEALAADVALHLWYSVFLPKEYRVQVGLAIAAALDKSCDDSTSVPVGRRSTVSWFYPPEADAYLVNLAPDAKVSKLSALDAQIEYRRVQGAHSRRDYRDRMYARLRPSHRVAVQEYRRSGIVLPFGAPNFHFDTPNVSLFSLNGRWLQDDSSDPLEGWDISAVIAAGKAHGARPEDIYGCLYFYLTEQLRTFAKRLRELSISFKLYSTEACGLACAIKSGRLTELDLPPIVRFDRIEVSNILDAQYVGMNAVLITWGPLLSDNPFATIVGYFMNWSLLEKDGDPKNCEEEIVDDCITRVVDRDEKANRLLASKPSGNPMTDIATVAQMLVTVMTVQALAAVYDNSTPFSTYLNKQGLSRILKKTKLRLKENHTIVSRRLRVPLQSPPDALPEFQDDDSWYNYTNLNKYTWVERFVEFSRE
ncbi:hypothetical protein H1R20_g16078, partial [Candolleomyces eurysporus]